MIGPSTVAQGYPTKPLGEIVEFLDHLRKPITASDRVPGDIPYYGANGQQDSVDGYIFDEPLVLVAEDGGHFDDPDRGIAYRIHGKTWVNNHAHVIRAGAHITTDWLCRVLENYDVSQFLTGSTRAKLTKSGASRIPIPLPPIEEQRRIAAVLDAADELRAKRRQALAKLDTLTQAIFIDMFGDPRRTDRWPIGAFSSICDSKLGKMLDKKQFTGTDLRPYLRVANIQWFNIGLDDVAEMDFKESERPKYRLEPNDVLICEGGSYPGRAAVWRGEMAECYFQKALHRCRPKAGLATGDYIASLMYNLDQCGALLDHTSSSTISHLTGAKLKKMKVICPPHELQELFAVRVRSVNQDRVRILAAAGWLDTLFASLQQRAFRGEL